MINTDTKYDKNFEDNHLYNRQRNQFIKNALQKSVELSEAVENKDLYTIAFTHGSYTIKHDFEYNYERLEFLGDSVLSLLVSEYLYKKYP